MNIKEAIDIAMPQGKTIMRKSWVTDFSTLSIIPTDSVAGLIVYNCLEHDPQKQLLPGWQPEASDLQADDWVVNGLNLE
ncbi:MAG: MW1434 family type I TA system toxin [Enterococcus casseliflavus]